jgi:hypothetical protein
MINILDNAINDYLKSPNKGSQNTLAFHLFNAFDELIDKNKGEQVLVDTFGCISDLITIRYPRLQFDFIITFDRAYSSFRVDYESPIYDKNADSFSYVMDHRQKRAFLSKRVEAIFDKYQEYKRDIAKVEKLIAIKSIGKKEPDYYSDYMTWMN